MMKSNSPSVKTCCLARVQVKYQYFMDILYFFLIVICCFWYPVFYCFFISHGPTWILTRSPILNLFFTSAERYSHRVCGSYRFALNYTHSVSLCSEINSWSKDVSSESFIDHFFLRAFEPIASSCRLSLTRLLSGPFSLAWSVSHVQPGCAPTELKRAHKSRLRWKTTPGGGSFCLWRFHTAWGFTAMLHSIYYYV